MKKILFILSALTVCFVALPEIKKAIRKIARNNSEETRKEKREEVLSILSSVLH